MKRHRQSFENLFGFVPFGMLYAVVHFMTRIL